MAGRDQSAPLAQACSISTISPTTSIAARDVDAQLLRKAVQFPPDPLFRYRGRATGLFSRVDQPRRQDPDSHRGRRRLGQVENIATIAARASSTSPAARAGYLRDGGKRCRSAVHAVAKLLFWKIDARLPRPPARMLRSAARRHFDRRRRRGRWRSHQSAVADILGERDRADLLRSSSARATTAGEGNFKALFRSIEEDQIRRGVLKGGRGVASRTLVDQDAPLGAGPESILPVSGYGLPGSLASRSPPRNDGEICAPPSALSSIRRMSTAFSASRIADGVREKH